MSTNRKRVCVYLCECASVFENSNGMCFIEYHVPNPFLLFRAHEFTTIWSMSSVYNCFHFFLLLLHTFVAQMPKLRHHSSTRDAFITYSFFFFFLFAPIIHQSQCVWLMRECSLRTTMHHRASAQRQVHRSHIHIYNKYFIRRFVFSCANNRVRVALRWMLYIRVDEGKSYIATAFFCSCYYLFRWRIRYCWSSQH